MPSASRLIGGRFYSIYTDAAALLSRQYRLRPHVEMGVLAPAHEAWKVEIYPSLQSGEFTGDQAWDHALRTIAVSLCDCPCVTYDVAGAVEPPYRENQELVVEFSAIYTGLQFVQTQYLSAVLANRNAINVEDFSRLQHPNLRGVLTAIRADVRLAADFVALLNLLPPDEPGSPLSESD